MGEGEKGKEGGKGGVGFFFFFFAELHQNNALKKTTQFRCHVPKKDSVIHVRV